MPNQSKKRKYYCAFKPEFTNSYPCVIEVKGDPNKGRCTVCNAEISVKYEGMRAVKMHVEGAKHRQAIASVNQCQKLLFSSRNTTTSLDQQVLNAEVLFTSMIVEHNIPFAVAQHATKIFERMFPDSNIAKKYKCSYTKTAAIVEYALEPESSKAMFKHIKDQRQPFTLMIDESNDILCDKECAILVRYFNESSGKVCVGFLDMPVCNVGTGAKIFGCVNETLVEKHGLQWENVAAFSSDNCNVMIGRRDSVLSRIKERAPEIYSVGCPSHLVNICCCKTAYKELDLNPESLIIDIYYYFEKSSKRRHELKEFQEFCGIAEDRIRKHCPTRWLSLGKSLKHLLTQWDALKSYFNSKSDNQKSRSIASRLNNPLMKVYSLFLTSIVPIFDRFNLVFQEKSSVLYRLTDCVEELLRSIAIRLIQPQYVRQAQSMKDLDITCVDHQWDNVNLGIGREAKLLLMSEEVTDLPERTVDRFYDDVRRYLTKSFEKVVEKFPLNCIVMENLKVVCPTEQDALTTEVAGDLAGRFPNVFNDQDLCDLECEVQDYQATNLNNLVNGFDKLKIDTYWYKLSIVKHISTGNVRFKQLSRLMKLLLILPHSNCDVERAFSVMNHIRTQYRASMSHQTLVNLMSCKINMFSDIDCYSFKPDSSVLSNARKATTTYNTNLAGRN